MSTTAAPPPTVLPQTTPDTNTLTTPPPPAYTPNSNITFPTLNFPFESDSDSEDDDTTLVINASTQIRGSGNVIAIPLIDAPRVSAALSSALKTQNTDVQVRRGRRRAINVQIHCGVTIVGERNVVGLAGLGVRAKAGCPLTAEARKEGEGEEEATATAGTKRKAEEDITPPPPKAVKVESV